MGVGVRILFDPHVPGWPGLLLLSVVSCAARELPSRWPDASAASPASPEAPIAVVTRSLEGPPPLPGDASPGWPGLEPSEGAVAAPVPASGAEDGTHAGHGAPTPDAAAVMGEPARSDDSGADADATYTCPMHSDVVSREPGKCPRCGMTLVKRDASK
jgi:heavy metal-binding protein